jgi:hypothetical protein
VPDDQLLEIWRRAGAHLDQARRSLTDPGDDALAQFDEFLQHNELGLALDELAEVARARRAPRVVWEELRAAAATMGLDSGDLAHGASVRLISERLTGARSLRPRRDWDLL